jgi:hypothetical protein
MKLISSIILIGALSLGGCNSSAPSNAPVDPRAAAVSNANRKIVGYSNDPQAAPSYGDAAGGGGGGGGHHH